MRLAFELAKEAYDDGEVPVGAVVVDGSGVVIGRGRNRRRADNVSTAHAELFAIECACKALGDWRLTDCSLYVTLEPCPMCAGAVIMSRIGKVFYGSADDLTGSCGSVINLFMEDFKQKTQITGGVLADECSALLSDFFDHVRKTRTL